MDNYASNPASTPGVGAPAGGSYREFVLFLHNGMKYGSISSSRCQVPGFNLRTAPFIERIPSTLRVTYHFGTLGGCPSITESLDPNVFSWVTYGDPITPLLRAYAGDPVVICTEGITERIDALRITSHRFRPERFNANGVLTDTGTTGISERFDYILDGEREVRSPCQATIFTITAGSTS